MNEIALTGCTSTPLAGYLKALGVMRLFSGAYPGALAAWRGDHLIIRADCDPHAIERYFLHDYRPTPIMAPWNGGSGFYEKDNKVALQAILKSSSSRLDLYRECLSIADRALDGVDRSASPKDAAKVALLARLRGLLPDAALEWFDASVLLSGDTPRYPPLLGTGGNDGRLDFTNNFMQRLGEVLSFDDEAPSKESIQWLRMALYGEPAPGLVKKAIGQFSPGQAGGPNATVGLEAEPAMNPWDFVLMIEGALAFAAAAVRRNADDPEGVLSYPFTVRAVGAGSGALGEGDAASSRGELWMPLWRKPASYAEIRFLLSEGRVALGRKPARDALDFVRAVHRLGGYRGIQSFQRYGLLMRAGKAFLATPLTRVEVKRDAPADWISSLDQDDWLVRFRRFAQGENVPNRYLALRRKLEDALFDLAGRDPQPAEAQAVLLLLADIQATVGVSKKAREAVPPVPRLPARWVKAADDGSAAYRVARAVSGLTGSANVPLPLVAQLYPVHPTHNVWMTPEYRGQNANDPVCRTRVYIGFRGSLVDTMITLLSERLRLAHQLGMRAEKADAPLFKPLRSPYGISAGDLLAFLRDDRMDRRIEELLRGLSLCEIPGDDEVSTDGGVVPAAFALLKLCFVPDEAMRDIEIIDTDDAVRVPKSLISELANGNRNNQAVRSAWRRLTATRIPVAVAIDALPQLGEIRPERAAAALLIPLRFETLKAMRNTVLMQPRKLTLSLQEELA
jgi:CRISPR-associated protein Csx17